MNNSKSISSNNCAVCGASKKRHKQKTSLFTCSFCGFEKDFAQKSSKDNNILIFSNDINAYFREKYHSLKKGETFDISVPVNRFYKSSQPIPGQVNFFKSKNIMFLLEQHGFQMVSRESRFSTQLTLIVRKV